MINVKLDFGFEFEGRMTSAHGSVPIGSADSSLRPYELLGGALGSCLYATFQEIVEKMRLKYDTCELDVSIEKRTEVPTTAKWILVKSRVLGGDTEKKEKYERAFKLATEHCSIYQTLSGVAEMHWELEVV